MEAAALAERANSIREGVVDVVEEHLIPAVAPAEHEGHDGMEHGPCAVWVVGQEAVPGQRVREVGDEHPSRGETDPPEQRHREHKAPTLAERPTERVSTEEPNTRP